MSPRPARPALRGALFPLACVVALGALAAPVFAQGYGGTVADTLVRADALLQQKRSNEAVVQYQEARTLCANPTEMVAAYQGEARALLQMKEPLAAAGLVEEAVSKYPEDPRVADLLFLAGVARRQGGDPAAAVPLLTKALESNPSGDIIPGLRFELARALRMSGQPEKVTEVLKDFETDYPDHPSLPLALYTLGIAQHDAQRLAESESTYRRLIEKFPQSQASVEAFLDMGDLLALKGDRAEAAEFFRRYSNSMPGSPFSARAMERAGDLTLFSSPTESALYYGVAKDKAAVNPPAPTPEHQVSGWLGAKLALAQALGNVWILVAAGTVLALLLAGIAVRVVKRRRAGSGAGAADRTASA